MTHEIDWKARADKIKERLDKGGYISADEYYADKDAYWEAIAKWKNTTPRKISPMNFWFGRQSN